VEAVGGQELNLRLAVQKEVVFAQHLQLVIHQRLFNESRVCDNFWFVELLNQVFEFELFFDVDREPEIEVPGQKDGLALFEQPRGVGLLQEVGVQLIEVVYAHEDVGVARLQSTVHYADDGVVELEEHCEAPVGFQRDFYHLDEFGVECGWGVEDESEEFGLFVGEVDEEEVASGLEEVSQLVIPLVGEDDLLQIDHEDIAFLSEYLTEPALHSFVRVVDRVVVAGVEGGDAHTRIRIAAEVLLRQFQCDILLEVVGCMLRLVFACVIGVLPSKESMHCCLKRSLLTELR